MIPFDTATIREDLLKGSICQAYMVSMEEHVDEYTDMDHCVAQSAGYASPLHVGSSSMRCRECMTCHPEDSITSMSQYTVPRNASYKTPINLNLTKQTLSHFRPSFITKTFPLL